MPQARFLGRRWRLATDSLPLLFYPLLTALSIFMFILSLALVAVTLSSNYRCKEFTKVGVALYGMAAVYFVELLVFLGLIFFGWRGGPLHESKRMPQMSIMIHIWITVIIIKLLFTVWGMYVVYSPTVSKECWSSNPCDSFSDELPKSCVPQATGNIQLTPSCQVVFNHIGEFRYCLDKWAGLGGGWMIDNYIGQEPGQYANFSYPGTVSCRNDVNWQKDKRLSEINPYDNRTNVFEFFIHALYVQAGIENDTSTIDVLPSVFQSVILSFISNGMYDHRNASFAELNAEIPWNDCMSAECMALLQNDCSQWEKFIHLPSTYRLSGWFAAIIYVSLAVCILTGLIFFVSFNAFPDYESPEAWQGLLSGIAKKLGYLEDLRSTATQDGVDALVGIGGLLHSLFGGADLDVTDLILGLYLVHLRQKWKRKEHALSHLGMHGYHGQEKVLSAWRSKLVGFIIFPLFKDGYHTRTPVPTEEGSQQGRRSPIGRMLSQGKSSSLSDVDRDLIHEMNSEFDHLMVEPSTEKKSQDTGVSLSIDDTLTLQHSFVRMQSVVSANQDDQHMAFHMENKGLVKLIKQDRALVTPLNLKNVKFNIDLAQPAPATKEDFVALYMGTKYRLVQTNDLKEVLHFLPIARASYGLIKLPWKACVEPKLSHRIQTRMYSYFKRCIPESTRSSYHQRRNFKHILRMTKIKEEDVLYASYTSGALSIIPYLILQDTATKNICISMRGTVGVADLITDLLSSPANISKEFSSGVEDQDVYAHAGITSSAIAVVVELKEKGIWDAFAHPGNGTPIDTHGASSRNLNDVENRKFSLSGAIRRIQCAIHREGYGLIVTGHSLGAAVACLVAAKMREIRPSVRCIAYNPPGGLLDENFRSFSEQFCTSVVCGQDAISRMSIRTMKRVIDDMMFALASCKRPKLSILLDSFIGRYVNGSAASRVFEKFDELKTDVIEVLLEYLQKSKFHQENVDDRPMYPPGNIIFLRPFGDITGPREASWDAVWLKAKGMCHGGFEHRPRLN